MPKKSIYLPDHVEKKVIPYESDPRGGFSSRLSDIIDRYDVIIRAAKKTIKKKLSAEDLFLIAQCNQGTVWQPAGLIIAGVAANLEDSENDYFENEADQARLVKLVESLSPAEHVALIEMINLDSF